MGFVSTVATGAVTDIPQQHQVQHYNSTPQWQRRFIEMTEKALYACDQCYRCKTRCEKSLPRCQRCQKQNSTCTYSVTGSEVFTLATDSSVAQDNMPTHVSRHGGEARPTMHRRAVTWASDTKRHRDIMSDQETKDQSAVMGHLIEMSHRPPKSQHHSVWNDRSQVQHQLLPKSPFSPFNEETTSSTKSCDCIRRVLESTRDIYLGSLQWDAGGNIVALERGIASCEPCPECLRVFRGAAASSSLLFLQRALMCMKQTSFQQSVAFGKPEMAMQCITVINRLHNFTCSASGDGPENYDSAAQFCLALQEGFGNVWGMLHNS